MVNKKQSTGRKGTSTSRRPTQSRGLSKADLAAAQELDRLLELQRRREQLMAQVPEGIQTQKLQYPDGVVVFRFSADIGELGQLRISPVPAYMAPPGGNSCVVQYELAPGDPDDDPQWDKKFRLFSKMVEVCVAALPGSGIGSDPLPTLEEAKEQQRLYARFIGCAHTDEMRAFVATLSEKQYNALLKVGQQASASASREDLPGILQRREELQMLWKERT